MTRYLNIDLDTTLGGVSPSDELVSSQKAVKTYVDGIIPSQSGNTGKFLTTDGSSISWEEIPPSVEIDNSTITTNSSDKIQAVATVNANVATGATTPIYDWVGTLNEYDTQNISTLHPEWVCYITDDYQHDTVVYNNHNVGDIFFTMRKEAALNGAVPCDGSTYSTTEYTGSQAIGTLLANGKLPYVSLSDYATLLSTNGSVGVFGWDGGSATAFRVPILTDIFIESGTAAQIGDYLAPGAPNIIGSAGTGDRGANIDASGAFGITHTGSAASKFTTQSSTAATNNGWTFDASRSSSIYGNSTTIQPNTVRYRAMVQLSTGFTDEAYSTCSSVQADVAANTAAIAGADYVIESQLPTADNNYTWYRKYKSGWVEQGGKIQINGPISSSNKRVSFPVTMANTNYFAIAAADANVDFVVYVGWQAVDGMSIGTKSDASTNRTTWEVKGMAAQ